MLTEYYFFRVCVYNISNYFIIRKHLFKRFIIIAVLIHQHKSESLQRLRFEHPTLRKWSLDSLLKSRKKTPHLLHAVSKATPWNHMARSHQKWRHPRKGWSKKHGKHLEAEAATLAWPHLQDGRRTNPQGSLVWRTCNWSKTNRTTKPPLQRRLQAGPERLLHQSSWPPVRHLWPEQVEKPHKTWLQTIRGAEKKNSSTEERRKKAEVQAREHPPVFMHPLRQSLPLPHRPLQS